MVDYSTPEGKALFKREVEKRVVLGIPRAKAEMLVAALLHEEAPMSRKLDLKFNGVLTKVKDGSVVPDDQWMCFLAKDDAFALTLPFYYDKCKELGADAEQLAAVEKTIRRLNEWRVNNPTMLKVPDAKGEKLND